MYEFVWRCTCEVCRAEFMFGVETATAYYDDEGRYLKAVTVCPGCDEELVVSDRPSPGVKRALDVKTIIRDKREKDA